MVYKSKKNEAFKPIQINASPYPWAFQTFITAILLHKAFTNFTQVLPNFIIKIWGYLDLYGVKKLYLVQVVLLIFCINLAIAGSKML